MAKKMMTIMIALLLLGVSVRVFADEEKSEKPEREQQMEKAESNCPGEKGNPEKEYRKDKERRDKELRKGKERAEKGDAKKKAGREKEFGHGKMCPHCGMMMQQRGGKEQMEQQRRADGWQQKQDRMGRGAMMGRGGMGQCPCMQMQRGQGRLMQGAKMQGRRGRGQMLRGQMMPGRRQMQGRARGWGQGGLRGQMPLGQRFMQGRHGMTGMGQWNFCPQCGCDLKAMGGHGSRGGQMDRMGQKGRFQGRGDYDQEDKVRDRQYRGYRQEPNEQPMRRRFRQSR